MEDVENEDDDAAEELFYLSQLDNSLTPNRMKRTLNDGAKPIVWRVQTPPKNARLNSSLSDNEADPLDHLCISKEQQKINDFCGHVFFKPRPRPSGLRRSDPDRDLTFFFPVQVSVTFHYYSDGHVAGLQRTAKSSHRHSRHVIPLSDSNRQPLESGADCQFYQLSCIKRSPIQ